jgi:DNA-binding response OmpR family regulator
VTMSIPAWTSEVPAQIATPTEPDGNTILQQGVPHGHAPSAATKGRVLVVEDEPGLAEVLALHLDGAGYETAIAHDGLSALYEMDRDLPRLVLLDLNVPVVSGFRLIQLLKQRADAPNLPVIVITALSFQEAEEVIRAGADDFITKPFMPAEVVTRVERVLGRTG